MNEETSNIQQENTNDSSSQLVSPVDLHSVAEEMSTANKMTIKSLASNQNERFRIAKIINNYDTSLKNRVINSVVCGVSVITFLTCGYLAARELGTFNFDLDTYKNNVEGVYQNISDGMLGKFQEIVNYIGINIGAINEASKDIITLDNLKGMLENFGPVGYISAALTAISSRRLRHNSRIFNEARSDYKAAEVAHNAEVKEIRRNLISNSIVGKFASSISKGIGVVYEEGKSIGEMLGSSISNFRKNNKKELIEQISEIKPVEDENLKHRM